MNNIKQEFPPTPDEEINERTKKAIYLLKEVATEAIDKKWKYVVLSGFAIDAYLGYISRNHKDVDLIMDKGDIKEAVSFLENNGHLVCESKGHGKDLLRVDPIDKETTRAAHCDIHISYFDEKSNDVVITMHGNEMRFAGNYQDISTEKEFLGVKIKVLLPNLLLKEKKDWVEKIGLFGREEKNAIEIDKIQKIMSYEK
jgi:hypothetical protein